MRPEGRPCHCAHEAEQIARTADETVSALDALDELERDLRRITGAGPVGTGRLAAQLVLLGWRKPL